MLNELQAYCISAGDQNKKAVIKRCLLMIQQDYRKELTLDDLSKRLYVSPSYLSRLFSEEMGCPLFSYLQLYRIEQAKKLIESSNLRMNEIAKQTGFASAISFSAVCASACSSVCGMGTVAGAVCAHPEGLTSTSSEMMYRVSMMNLLRGR